MERASRIQENSALAVERKAEAQKDRELGALHYVKALKELQDMDLSQIEKMIALANQLQAMSQVKATVSEAVEETNQTPQGEVQSEAFSRGRAP